MNNNYRTLKIPKEMVDEIEKLIEEHPELGYKSNAEFVKEAIRSLIKDLKEK